MSKRRILKKHISYICGEMLAEVVSISLYQDIKDKAVMNEVVAAILKMQDEMLRRVSHTEPGNVKGFYKKLRHDMAANVDEILDQINNLH